MIERVRVGLLAALLVLAVATPARAVPPRPIPEGPDAATLAAFSGRPAVQHPVRVPDPPRHPFMAPNGRSNLHVDGYQSDVHQGPGPLGRQMDFYCGRKRVAPDRRRPLRRVVRVGRGRAMLRARILLLDGRRVVRRKRLTAH